MSSATELSILASTDRINSLKQAVQESKPAICSERALSWTRYFKKRTNRNKPKPVQIAQALQCVLLEKTATIYPDELIVGNYTSKRVGGSILPELHGVAMLEDIFKFSTRATNPLQISDKDKLSLLGIIPFWLPRLLLMKTFRSPLKNLKLVNEQINPHFYLINEGAGVSHLAPDYEKLINLGTDAMINEARNYQKSVVAGSASWHFYEGVCISLEALAKFGERYSELAQKLAQKENLSRRKRELLKIAEVCKNVPRKAATSLQEALQSLFFAQVAINHESLDNSVCPGRMDQYLLPFYQKDLESGKLTRNQAKELVATFCIKTSEIVPILSERLLRIHGGMFNGQVVTVGGLDSDGRDASNELTYIFLEVMDELRMRQPNFHARVHSRSPVKYWSQLTGLLANGSNSPALYNDDIIVDTLCKQGISVEDARDYTGIGCVEPVVQGKSFASTDAALVNVPLVLELALNEGRRFGETRRTGLRTKALKSMSQMEEIKEAFELQLRFRINKLIGELHAVELANRNYHPTPLTSALLDGCLKTGKCSTAGGAKYNASGLQCVAASDVGDSLYAIEQAVFVEKKITLIELAGALKNNFSDKQIHAYLKGLDKFGNDIEAVDFWSIYVVETFNKLISQFQNTRGGQYVTGVYSVTAHEYWGQITSALPNGRRKGEPFASGLAPANGMDKKGPTALLNSVNRFDFSKIVNGVNFNLKFDVHTLRGQEGKLALKGLMKTFFRRGGMQAQINVLDPKVLLDARDNPDRYPNLLVRVSGYSAYFNDLTPAMKEELIQRSSIAVH